MWDLISQTGDQTHALCSASVGFNHWSTKEVSHSGLSSHSGSQCRVGPHFSMALPIPRAPTAPVGLFLSQHDPLCILMGAEPAQGFNFFVPDLFLKPFTSFQYP